MRYLLGEELRFIIKRVVLMKRIFILMVVRVFLTEEPERFTLFLLKNIFENFVKQKTAEGRFFGPSLLKLRMDIVKSSDRESYVLDTDILHS